MDTIKRDCIKELMITNHLNNQWLAYQLKTYFDINVNGQELSRILGGRIHTPKAQKVLDASLILIKDYDTTESSKQDRLNTNKEDKL